MKAVSPKDSLGYQSMSNELEAGRVHLARFRGSEKNQYPWTGFMGMNRKR